MRMDPGLEVAFPVRFYLDNDVDHRCRRVLIGAGHVVGQGATKVARTLPTMSRPSTRTSENALLITHDRESPKGGRRTPSAGMSGSNAINPTAQRCSARRFRRCFPEVLGRVLVVEANRRTADWRGSASTPPRHQRALRRVTPCSGCRGAGDAVRPECIPDAIDLRLQLTGDHRETSPGPGSSGGQFVESASDEPFVPLSGKLNGGRTSVRSSSRAFGSDAVYRP